MISDIQYCSSFNHGCESSDCGDSRVFKDFSDSSNSKHSSHLTPIRYSNIDSASNYSANRSSSSNLIKAPITNPPVRKPVKLPRINVPSFSGDVLQWPHFHGLH